MTLRQINNGDPIDVNTINQMIATINALTIQVSQIYNLPSPQASFVVNNTGASGSAQGASADGTGAKTKTILVSVKSGKNLEGYVPYKASFGKEVVTITDDIVKKAAGVTVKDWAIVGVSYSNLQYNTSSKTKSDASGIKIITTPYAKSFGWQFEKNGLNKWTPGTNVPKDNASGIYDRIYFTWRIDVEVSY